MSWRRKLLLWSGGLALTVTIVVYSARHVIAHKAIESGFHQATGFEMKVGSLGISPLQSRLEARDIRVFNPPEFVDRTFVEVPRLYVDYEFGSLLRQKPRVSQLDVHLKRLVIVKNADGRSNIQQLAGVGSSEKQASNSPTPFRIDVLNLQIGTVTLKDYSGPRTKERSVALNINETFHNITESTDINRLVLLSVMKNVGLMDFGIQAEILRGGLGEVKTAGGELVKKSTHVVKEAGQKLAQAVKKLAPKKRD